MNMVDRMRMKCKSYDIRMIPFTMAKIDYGAPRRHKDKMIKRMRPVSDMLLQLLSVIDKK
jgi:hypothetical protein